MGFFKIRIRHDINKPISISVMGRSLNYKSDNRYFNPLSFFVISARHGVQKVEFVHPP